MSDPPDPAAGIIARLAEGAELVDGGAFTLDPAAARAKLADRQLADPEAWVLLVIEAAELIGAERVVLRELGTGLRVRIEGPSAIELAPPDSLDQLFSWVFTKLHGLDPAARRLARARQLLALAVNANTARGGHWMTLRVTTPDRGQRMMIKRDQPLRVSAQAAGPAKLDVISHDRDTRPLTVRRECRLVVRRCGYGEVAVHVAGKRVPAQPRLGPRKLEQALDLDGRRIGRVGLLHQLVEPQLSIVTNGVELETVALAGFNWGFFAIVADTLERDLSLGSAIRGQHFDATLAAIREAHDQLITRLRSSGAAGRELAAWKGEAAAARPAQSSALARITTKVERPLALMTISATVGLWPVALVLALFSMWTASAVFGALWVASSVAAIRQSRLRQLFGDADP